MSLAVRVDLHRKLAEVLEQRHGDERLSELAHHLLQASVAGGDRRFVDVAVRAAERSFGLLAYEEAAGWYARALDVLRAEHSGDTREGDLLLRRGEAHLAAGDLPSARNAYQEAAVLGRRRGDADLLARAALGGEPRRRETTSGRSLVSLLIEASLVVRRGPPKDNGSWGSTRRGIATQPQA